MKPKQLILCLGTGVLLDIFLTPYLGRQSWVATALSEKDWRLVVGAYLVLLLVLILAWGKSRNYLGRYGATWQLSGKPTLMLDYIVVIALSFITAFVILGDHTRFQLSMPVCWAAIIFPITAFIWLLSAYYLPKKKDKPTQTNTDSASLSDEPIKDTSQDILEREPFVERLYEEITKLPLSDSFVFGLSGKWGEGKSSVVNLLNQKIKGNDDFVLVEYTPWYYESKEALLSSFYGLIERALNQKLIVPNLKRVLIKYEQVIKNGISLSGLNLKFRVKEDSPPKLKALIESYLSATDKKLLVVIDELDRLQPDELMFVFQLVRLNTNLKNTIFVLVFDQDIVVRNMPEPFKGDKHYLEKIIQKQLSLPEINQRVIDDFVGKGIDELLVKLGVSKPRIKKLEKDFPSIYQSEVKVFIKTVRSAKRYLNNIASALPPVVNELDLSDFLIMELLALVAPKIYDDIWEHPWYYIPTEWTSNFGSFLELPYTYSLDDSQKYPDIRKHIEELLNDTDEPEVVKELLTSVFFVEVKNAFANNRTGHDSMIASYRRDQRITHPDVFRKYFYQRVPENDISDEFLTSLLNQWMSAPNRTLQKKIIKQSFEEVKKLGKLLDLIRRLKVFYNDDYKTMSLVVVEVISENIEIFATDGNERWNTEFEQAVALIFTILNDTVPDKRSVQAAVKKIVANSDNFVLVTEAIHWSDDRNSNSLRHIVESVNVPILKTIATRRMKEKYLDTGDNIFTTYPSVSEWGFLLFQWARGWKISGGNNAGVNDYLENIFTADFSTFKKFLKEFLQKSHSWNGDSVEEYRLTEIAQAFDIASLKSVAETHISTISNSRDKTFLRKFVKSVEDYQSQVASEGSGQ